jgi:hypothetical protein
MNKNFLIVFWVFIIVLLISTNFSCVSDKQNDGYANVRDFGAIGDGAHDDTKAIKNALASLPNEGGTVLFPPGHYLTQTIKGKNRVTFMGHSGWGYDRDSVGSSVISPLHGDLNMLFDLTGSGAVGVRIISLTLDGQNKGEGMHGIYSKHPGTEQNIVFEDCKIQRFTGSGIRLDNCWVFAIRRCLIMSNKGAGMDGSTSYDGWIIDNQITGNGNGGIFGDPYLSVVSITANRIEWNRRGGIVLASFAGQQITGNSFDRNFGPAISVEDTVRKNSRSNTITGNMFRRNGYQQHNNGKYFSHLLLKNVKGTTIVGNTFLGISHGVDRERERPPSPGYGMILENLENCVVSYNSLHKSALFETILDKGGHKNSVIESNPGSLREKQDWAMELLKSE